MGLPGRAAASVGLGLAAGGISFAIENGLSYSQGEQNARVTACVSALGEKAMQSASSPYPCQPFERSFPYKETMVRVYTPPKQGELEGTNHVTKKRVFTLPSAHEFRAENIVTAAEDNRNKTAREVGAVVVAGIGALLAFATVEVESLTRIRRRPPEPKQERAVR